MLKNPKISIITVCCNSQSTIKHTIDSVSSQTYKNKEYILIDGASNDWTLDILDFKKDEIDNFVSEQDGGIYDADGLADGSIEDPGVLAEANVAPEWNTDSISFPETSINENVNVTLKTDLTTRATDADGDRLDSCLR